MANAALIQSGENTHHHDQAITPASLAMTKMIVNHATIPILFILALVLIYCFAEILKPLPPDEDPVF
jgi:hypothetical protein